MDQELEQSCRLTNRLAPGTICLPHVEGNVHSPIMQSRSLAKPAVAAACRLHARLEFSSVLPKGRLYKHEGHSQNGRIDVVTLLGHGEGLGVEEAALVRRVSD